MAVRLYREEAALRAVNAAERAVTAAAATVTHKREELEAYRRWRPAEEERRYAAIIDQSLCCAELDAFKSGLIALALTEQQREQDLRAAEETLRQCRIQLEGCRGQLALARKDTSRLETHRDIWKKAQDTENTRKEDLELEDFRPAPSMEISE